MPNMGVKHCLLLFMIPGARIVTPYSMNIARLAIDVIANSMPIYGRFLNFGIYTITLWHPQTAVFAVIHAAHK